MIKRVLFFAYYYPPCGGPAAIRAAKTVKYLISHGVEVDVITAKNVFNHSTDIVLAEESHPTRIDYASGCDLTVLLYWLNRDKECFDVTDCQSSPKDSLSKKMYFSLPEKWRIFLKGLLPVDEKILWFWSAKRAGLNNLRKRQYDLIMATVGPYTSGVIARSLKTQTKLPILIDFRDHWTLNPYQKYLTSWHRKIAALWEHKIAESADYLVFIGKRMQAEFFSQHPQINAKSEVVYNGFDESDFAMIPKQEDSSGFIFTYTGHFYGQRSPYYFCAALLKLKVQGLINNNIQVRFAGNYHQDAMKIINNPELKGITKMVSYLSHRECIELLMSSDCLLLFIPSVDGKGVITSKIFEYIRSGKYILAMIPEESEAADLLREHCDSRRYRICDPEDISQIASAIEDIISQKISSSTSQVSYNNLSREAQTEKLITLLNGQVNE